MSKPALNSEHANSPLETSVDEQHSDALPLEETGELIERQVDESRQTPALEEEATSDTPLTEAGKPDSELNNQCDEDPLVPITAQNWRDEIEFSPIPENLTGLIDPERPSSSALIHESDLQIARNLRRLEIHRFEMAAALESLKEAEIGDVIDEEEEIELPEAEQHYLRHIEQLEKKRRKKRLDPDQIIDETVNRLKDGITIRAKKLFSPGDLKDLEFMGHNLCHTWHRLRYDQAIEDRLFRPEAECPARAEVVEIAPEETDSTTPDTSFAPNWADEQLDDIAKFSDAPAPSKISSADETVETLITNRHNHEVEAKTQDNDTPSEPEKKAPLCAPVHLVNWSLDQLAHYQEGQSFRHYAFLDPNAGHGRTLLIAAERDFRAIWGLEDQEELAEAAILNIRQYPRSYMMQRNIELFKDHPNISQWADQPLIVHLFNPRSEEWVISLLEALHGSFYENPRQIYLITIGNDYKAPFEEAAFLQAFTPPVSNLETFRLFSPYTIEFYHSVMPA